MYKRGHLQKIRAAGHDVKRRNGEFIYTDKSAIDTITWSEQEEVIYQAVKELEETDAYFESPRVKEDAMFGVITPEHQEMRDKREALRKIVRGQ